MSGDAFVANLRSVARVAAGTREATLTGDDVARLLLQRGPPGPRHIEFAITSCSWFESLRCACPTASTALQSNRAIVSFRIVTAERIAAEDEAPRVCAINTIVHEWTHAIPRAATSTEWKFTDESPRRSPQPLASRTDDEPTVNIRRPEPRPEPSPRTADDLQDGHDLDVITSARRSVPT